MTTTVKLDFQHPRETWESFVGVKLSDHSYDRVFATEDADVLTPEGDLLFKVRRRVLPNAETAAAYDVLKTITNKTNNRWMAQGKIYVERKRTTKVDGGATRTPRPENPVMSSIIGYFDRYPRTPFCRETAFNADKPAAFRKVLPFLQAVSREYERASPDRFALQKAVVDKTSKDFVIPGTVFTTITVNQNFQTAVHTDQGDLKDGLSCILVLAAGSFSGGTLVFPHYRAAVHLNTGDLLLFDSHHMHGNTPIVGQPGGFKRVSLVLYYRERMIDCGTAAQELERAKRRQPGDKLHGKLVDSGS